MKNNKKDKNLAVLLQKYFDTHTDEEIKADWDATKYIDEPSYNNNKLLYWFKCFLIKVNRFISNIGKIFSSFFHRDNTIIPEYMKELKELGLTDDDMSKINKAIHNLYKYPQLKKCEVILSIGKYHIVLTK